MLDCYAEYCRFMHQITIFRIFTFDAAHFLPNVPDEHKCRNLHGHTYKLTIYISGVPDRHTGWIMDFALLKEKVNNVLSLVDHHLLNEVEGLANPTCEQLAIWLWDKIKTEVPAINKIELYETPQSGVVYCGEFSECQY